MVVVASERCSRVTGIRVPPHPSDRTDLGLGEAAEEQNVGGLAADELILAVASLVCKHASRHVRAGPCQSGCMRRAVQACTRSQHAVRRASQRRSSCAAVQRQRSQQGPPTLAMTVRGHSLMPPLFGTLQGAGETAFSGATPALQKRETTGSAGAGHSDGSPHVRKLLARLIGVQLRAEITAAMQAWTKSSGGNGSKQKSEWKLQAVHACHCAAQACLICKPSSHPGRTRWRNPCCRARNECLRQGEVLWLAGGGRSKTRACPTACGCSTHPCHTWR